MMAMHPQCPFISYLEPELLGEIVSHADTQCFYPLVCTCSAVTNVISLMPTTALQGVAACLGASSLALFSKYDDPGDPASAGRLAAVGPGYPHSLMWIEQLRSLHDWNRLEGTCTLPLHMSKSVIVAALGRIEDYFNHRRCCSNTNNHIKDLAADESRLFVHDTRRIVSIRPGY